MIKYLFVDVWRGALVFAKFPVSLSRRMMLVCLLFLQAGIAQPVERTDVEPMVLPIKVVHGRIITTGYVTDASERRTKSNVSYEVSLECPHTLLFGKYGDLWMDGSQLRAGDSVFVDISFKPDVVIKIPGREIVPAPRPLANSFDEFSVIHEPDLQGHILAGVLGQGFLQKYRVVLDLPGGKLWLYPLTADIDRARAVTMPFAIRNGLMRISVSYADGKHGEMALGDSFDSFIDRQLAISLGKPAGDVSPITLSGEEGGTTIDLSRYVAFRPNKPTGVGGAVKNTAVFTAGVNLLESLCVDIDWDKSRVGFTPGKIPEYPQADFEFFKAQAEANAEQLQKYLEKNDKSRLAPDAAVELIELRLAAKESADAQIMQAFQWVANTSPIPNRTLEMLRPYIEKIRQMPDRLNLGIQAAELALTYSRAAITIQDAYRLHYSLGEDYLQQGKTKDAWRHLLSAAFQPLEPGRFDEAGHLISINEDGHNIAVNARLGKVYEERGRIVRAYSRYKKAADSLARYVELLDGRSEAELARSSPEALRNIRLLQMVRPDIEAALERLGPQVPVATKKMLDESR